MGMKTYTCRGCGVDASFELPEEIDGIIATTWECPDASCSHRNLTGGITSAEIAYANVGVYGKDDTIHAIFDGDIGTSKE